MTWGREYVDCTALFPVLICRVIRAKIQGRKGIYDLDGFEGDGDDLVDEAEDARSGDKSGGASEGDN